MPHENDKDLRTLCKKAADKIADSFRVGFVDERMVEIFTKDIYDTFKGQVMLAKVQQESQPAPNTPAHHQRIGIEEITEMLRSLLSLYFKEARCEQSVYLKSVSDNPLHFELCASAGWDCATMLEHCTKFVKSLQGGVFHNHLKKYRENLYDKFTIELNGCRFTIDPDWEVESCRRMFKQAQEAARIAYERSDAYKKAQAHTLEKRKECQRVIDECVKRLVDGPVMVGHELTIWIRDYVGACSGFYNESVRVAEVMEKLRSDYLGRIVDEYERRVQLSMYITEVIDAVAKGALLPPEFKGRTPYAMETGTIIALPHEFADINAYLICILYKELSEQGTINSNAPPLFAYAMEKVIARSVERFNTHGWPPAP